MRCRRMGGYGDWSIDLPPTPRTPSSSPGPKATKGEPNTTNTPREREECLNDGK